MKSIFRFSAFVFAFFAATSAFAAGGKVLFVVGNNGNPNPMSASDTTARFLMRSAGYTVDDFDDDQVPAITAETAQAKVNDYDCVVISSSVSGGKVAPYAWVTKPVILWEGAALKPFGMALSQGGYAEITMKAVFADKATFPIVNALKDTMAISTLTTGSLASATTTKGKALATYPGDATKVAWLMYEAGDDLDVDPAALPAGVPGDNKAVATRIFIPHDNNSFTTATPASISILLNSIDYSIDNKIDNGDYTKVKEVSASKYTTYPNPVRNVLNIKGDNINSVSIFNTVGAQVLKSKTATGINVSDLSKGVYFVQISTENGIISTKMVKE